MKSKNLMLMVLIALISLFACGCQDEAVVRQIALQLHGAVVEDEKLIDNHITQQTEFYQKQRETIDNARSQNIPFQLEAFRRMSSAQAATNMSANPDKEARLGNLMNYLHETHDKEFALWQELYGGDQEAREELKSRIAKLERQKKVLAQVKENLNQLALAPNSKKRAKVLLQFSQETYTAFKKSTQK